MNAEKNTEEEKTAARASAEKPFTREMKRKGERIAEEANKTYEAICDRFLEFFTHADDPNSREVTEKAASMSKQWRLYCQQKRLLPKAYPLVDNFIKGLIDQYNKSEVIESPTENQEPNEGDA